MAHKVESMFYAGQTPWHGLGTAVEECLTSADALQKAGLDWRVIRVPVFVEEAGIPIEVPDYFANVRATDHKVLGVTGKGYRVCQNDEAFVFIDALLNEGVRYETAGSLEGGKQVWMLAKLPETYAMPDGQDVRPYVCFSNRHDGTGAVRVILTPIRVVCANTLALAIGDAKRSWSTHHVGDVQARLDEARRVLELSRDYYGALGKHAEDLIEKRVTQSDWDHLVKMLVPLTPGTSPRAQNTVAEKRATLSGCLLTDNLREFRHTGWGAVNAVSDYVTHSTPARMTATYRERLFGQMFSGYKMIDTANDYCLAL